MSCWKCALSLSKPFVILSGSGTAHEFIDIVMAESSKHSMMITDVCETNTYQQQKIITFNAQKVLFTTGFLTKWHIYYGLFIILFLVVDFNTNL